MLPGMALNHLTESERDAILNVLQRDDALRQKEQERVSVIQSSIKLLRLKGVIRSGQDANHTCARCRVSFGWFFNKGAVCVQCQHKVCDACRHLQSNKTWLCTLCFKQMETAAKTGEWFYSKFRKSKRNKRTNRIVTGSEIIRSSIRKPSRSSVASNAASSVSEEVKRALTNNNAPLWRMDESDAEKTDTPLQTPGTPPTGAPPPTFMAAFPRESDTQKLLQLIRPRAANSPTATPATEMHVRVVSTQRYKDSDSSSDSEDEAPPSSSVLPGSSRSSPVPSSSIASSDGWATVVTDNVSDLDIATCSSDSNSPPGQWSEQHRPVTAQTDPWSSSRSTGSSSETIEECTAHGDGKPSRQVAPAEQNTSHQTQELLMSSQKTLHDVDQRKQCASEFVLRGDGQCTSDQADSGSVTSGADTHPPLPAHPTGAGATNPTAAGVGVTEPPSPSSALGRSCLAQSPGTSLCGDGDGHVGGRFSGHGRMHSLQNYTNDVVAPKHLDKNPSLSGHTIYLPPSAYYYDDTAATTEMKRGCEPHSEDVGNDTAVDEVPCQLINVDQTEALRARVSDLLARLEKPQTLYDDAVHCTSPFEELEWDADVLGAEQITHEETASHLTTSTNDVLMRELRVSVSAAVGGEDVSPSKYKNSETQARLLDDDDDDDEEEEDDDEDRSMHLLRTHLLRPQALSDDVSSDCLSIITEYTEPDEEFGLIKSDDEEQSDPRAMKSNRTSLDGENEQLLLPVMSNETSDVMAKKPVQRRDTLTMMAVEAATIADHKEDLASLYESNKHYVSNSELADIMNDQLLLIPQKVQHEACSDSVKEAIVDMTPVMRDLDSKSVKVTKQMVQDVGKSSSGEKSELNCRLFTSSEAVDVMAARKRFNDNQDSNESSSSASEVSDHIRPSNEARASSVTELQKLFEQPSNFMVPKVSTAYLPQQDVDLHHSEQKLSSNDMESAELGDQLRDVFQHLDEESNTDADQRDINSNHLHNIPQVIITSFSEDELSEDEPSLSCGKVDTSKPSVVENIDKTVPLMRENQSSGKKPLVERQDTLTMMAIEAATLIGDASGLESPVEKNEVSRDIELGIHTEASIPLNTSPPDKVSSFDVYIPVVPNNSEDENEPSPLCGRVNTSITFVAENETGPLMRENHSSRKKPLVERRDTLTMMAIEAATLIGDASGLESPVENNEASRDIELEIHTSIPLNTSPPDKVSSFDVYTPVVSNNNIQVIPNLAPVSERASLARVDENLEEIIAMKAKKQAKVVNRNPPLLERQDTITRMAAQASDILGDEDIVEFHSIMEDNQPLQKENESHLPSEVTLSAVKTKTSKNKTKFCSANEEKTKEKITRKSDESKKMAKHKPYLLERQDTITLMAIEASNTADNGEENFDSLFESNKNIVYKSELTVQINKDADVQLSTNPEDQADLCNLCTTTLDSDARSKLNKSIQPNDEKMSKYASCHVDVAHELQALVSPVVSSGVEKVDRELLGEAYAEEVYEECLATRLEDFYMASRRQVSPASVISDDEKQMPFSEHVAVDPQNLHIDDNASITSADGSELSEPGESLQDHCVQSDDSQLKQQRDGHTSSSGSCPEWTTQSEIDVEMPTAQRKSVTFAILQHPSSSVSSDDVMSSTEISDLDEIDKNIHCNNDVLTVTADVHSQYGSNPHVAFNSAETDLEYVSSVADNSDSSSSSSSSTALVSLEKDAVTTEITNSSGITANTTESVDHYGNMVSGVSSDCNPSVVPLGAVSVHLPTQPDTADTDHITTDSTHTCDVPTESVSDDGGIKEQCTDAMKESETVLPPVTASQTDDDDDDRVTPVPSITIIQARQRSLQSEEEEEEDDIDECFQTHASLGHNGNKNLAGYRGSNLLTPFSTSTESMLSFYSDAGEGNYGKIAVQGEIRFGLQYNYKTGALQVTICECRNLATVDAKRKRSDPYVKTYLLPDKTKNGKRKTRVKKHTLNPAFDEVLKYHITKSELESRTLWITVWHNDRFGRNDFLGEVTLPLDYYEFGDGTPEWHTLKDRNTLPMSLLTYKGDLIISLKYVSVEKQSSSGRRNNAKGALHVLVKQARNLTAVRSNGSSDPFCKGYLWPDKSRHAKQKTAVIKRDCNPCWNHTFVFDDVAWEELRERCLELTVWDHDRFTSNDFLGGVRLNLGAGSSAGKEVDWMDAKGEEISIWQSMLDRPNYWIEGNLLLRPNMEKRK